MDRGVLLDRAASSPEERILLARVLNKYDQCRRRSIPAVTSFLSPAEQQAAERLLHMAGIHTGFLWNGGYEGAERRLLQFLPDWAEEDTGAVGCLLARFRGGEAPGHRDCLGSLMGLGIVREKLGDILLLPDACEVIAAAYILPCLAQNWVSAGRVRLSVSELPLSELVIPEQKVRTIRDTVMSLRLDAVTASGFSLSRGKAAELIASGCLRLNHIECTKCDRTVAAGDIITARGLGKFVLSEVGGLSKKGRTAVTILRYL